MDGTLDQNNQTKPYPAEHSHHPASAKALSSPLTPGTPEEMPYLKVANHGEASSTDPASSQPQGVEEGWPQALQEVGIAQQSHQDDCGRETQPRHCLQPPSSHCCLSQPCFPSSRHLPMKEPRLQMRLKKQLSGGRVPHLLWGQTRPTEPQTGGMLGSLLRTPSWVALEGSQRSSAHAPTPRPLT